MIFRKIKRKLRYNPKRYFFLLFLVLFVSFVGIGYALIATNLLIEGSVDVDSSKWDVYFDHVTPLDGSVAPTEDPSIVDGTTLSFTAVIGNPGSFYGLTVDIVNNGTMNAEIDNISISPTLTAEQQEYLEYTVQYVNGAPVETGDILLANSFKKIKIVFQYKESPDISVYPTVDVTLDFSVSLHYSQKSPVSYGDYTFTITGTGSDPTLTGYLSYEDGTLDELSDGDSLSLPIPTKVKWYVDSSTNYTFSVGGNAVTSSNNSVFVTLNESSTLDIHNDLPAYSYRFYVTDYNGTREYQKIFTGPLNSQTIADVHAAAQIIVHQHYETSMSLNKCSTLTFTPVGGSSYTITDYSALIQSTEVGTYYCYNRTCLSGDTEVEVYDKKKKKRKKKKLRDVGPDDLILCWDFEKGEFTFAQPLWIKQMEIIDFYYLLKFSDGSSLKVVGDHKIYDVDKKRFVNAGLENEFEIGAHVFNSKGEVVELVSRDEITEKIDSYSVITDYHMNLFANGILTSCVFSNIYPIEDMKYQKDALERLSDEEFIGIAEEYIKGLRLREVPMNFRGDKDSTVSYIHSYVQQMIDKKQ